MSPENIFMTTGTRREGELPSQAFVLTDITISISDDNYLLSNDNFKTINHSFELYERRERMQSCTASGEPLNHRGP